MKWASLAVMDLFCCFTDAPNREMVHAGVSSFERTLSTKKQVQPCGDRILLERDENTETEVPIMATRDASYSPPPHGFRTFVLLWAFQSLAAFGFQITAFAITVWLTTGLYPAPDQKAMLAAALSMTGLAFGLPNVLVAPLAGVLIDRVDRKTVMFWANVGSGLVSLSLAVVLGAGALRLWILVVAMVLYGSLQCLHTSAFETSYAMLVPASDLPRANGMMQTVMSLAAILTPPIAAGLMALPDLLRKSPSPTWIARFLAGVPNNAVLPVAVDALALFIAAGSLLYLKIPSPSPSNDKSRPSLLADIRAGMSFIARRRGLLWLLATFAVVNFCSAPAGVLRPMIVRDNPANDYAALGLSYEGVLALMTSAGSVGAWLAVSQSQRGGDSGGSESTVCWSHL